MMADAAFNADSMLRQTLNARTGAKSGLFTFEKMNVFGFRAIQVC
jgi:hypothetical protein